MHKKLFLQAQKYRKCTNRDIDEAKALCYYLVIKAYAKQKQGSSVRSRAVWKEKCAVRDSGFRYSKDFDEKYEYRGKDLGAECRGGATFFKVWAPLAEAVEVCLYLEGTAVRQLPADSLPGDGCRRVPLEKKERGCWGVALPEDLHGVYYDYLVYREGETVRTADPYARACSRNGCRSMVVDLARTNPEGFAEDRAPEKGVENIIYELHIKDFSHDPDSGIPEEYRGKYKAFTVENSSLKGGAPTCMAYLRELGVTHVHLLPFFDFGWLDEADDNQFNWGYDPVNYNVPEGSFATDTGDGTVRIRECKEMIGALHRAGLRVVMDVVYNHTQEADSWLERMMPGYYARRYEDGTLSDGSACGSDMAVGRAMVDNYIADSVMYWAREYHLDGFRFDLMGLLTTELMNRIRGELDAEFGDGEKLLYGEPWRANESPMEAGTHAALKINIGHLHENIAVFCDDTRDVIKGDVFFPRMPGFVNGGRGLEERMLDAVTGWRKNGNGFHPRSCNQVVNYVSAHDNFTLWDKLLCTLGEVCRDKEGGTVWAGREESGLYEEPLAELLAVNKLAAMIYFTCQGHLFFQAGEEFGRTKFGDENSFRSAPEINMLSWSRTVRFRELLDYYKGLIALRKTLPGLCDKSFRAAERVTGQTVHREGVVSFYVDNTSEEYPSGWGTLFIVYNASDTAELLEPAGADWEILADETSANCRRRAGDEVRVAARSGMVLGKNRGVS